MNQLMSSPGSWVLVFPCFLALVDKLDVLKDPVYGKSLSSIQLNCFSLFLFLFLEFRKPVTLFLSYCYVLKFSTLSLSNSSFFLPFLLFTMPFNFFKKLSKLYIHTETWGFCFVKTHHICSQSLYTCNILFYFHFSSFVKFWMLHLNNSYSHPWPLATGSQQHIYSLDELVSLSVLLSSGLPSPTVYTAACYVQWGLWIFKHVM